MKTMYEVKIEIGTAKSGDTWTYSELAEGIENLTEAMNYVINKNQFMANKGWGSTHVTGAHPEWTLTGKRITGDAAQDYIFGLKDRFGSARESSIKITVVGAQNTVVWVQDVVISDMQEWSGATTDDSSISITISSNGRPTVTSSAE